MTGSLYLTTSLPYVNAAPHLGHALEFVHTDVLARHARARGRDVRLLSGTDDNAIKNVRAAAAAGRPVADFVATNAAAFRRLLDSVEISVDDQISTGSDPRHALGVEWIWRAADARGDFYRRSYRGLYCAGCEQFYAAEELDGGRCPEHRTEVEEISESNWFFRLSGYADQIEALLAAGTIAIEPAERAAEALAFVRSGLADISVSRPRSRSRGWGVTVPGDPEQVIYVWWDALAGYLSALGLGAPLTPETTVSAYERWWRCSDRRIHVIGKGILRFHAVYWIGLLLSARLPLPSAIFVHEYLTAGGRKIAKTSGVAVDPFEVIADHGVDAVRWWLISDVSRPRDTDYDPDRVITRYRQDLAGGIGNLVNRCCRLLEQARGGLLADLPGLETSQLRPELPEVQTRIDAALAGYDLRAATAALGEAVAAANRWLEETAPWLLAARERTSGRTEPALDQVLTELIGYCRGLADELAIFIPSGAARLRTQLGNGNRIGPQSEPAFPRRGTPLAHTDETPGPAGTSSSREL
jgi:methionyl-tRNA synthetase